MSLREIADEIRSRYAQKISDAAVLQQGFEMIRECFDVLQQGLSDVCQVTSDVALEIGPCLLALNYRGKRLAFSLHRSENRIVVTVETKEDREQVIARIESRNGICQVDGQKLAVSRIEHYISKIID